MKSWNSIEKTKLKPELLSHPHIPKPLHGINPRTIMGRKAWNVYRQAALTRTNHSCKACGATGVMLELHEDYVIDYKKGCMKVNSMEPLCVPCHRFIHTGLLGILISQGQIDRFDGISIIKRGIQILKDNNLPIFVATKQLAKVLGVNNQGLKVFVPPKSNVAWQKWYLEWGGEKYYGMSQQQWKEKYQ